MTTNLYSVFFPADKQPDGSLVVVRKNNRTGERDEIVFDRKIDVKAFREDCDKNPTYRVYVNERIINKKHKIMMEVTVKKEWNIKPGVTIKAGSKLIISKAYAEQLDKAGVVSLYDLPEDLPGLEHITAAGITTLDQLQEVADLTSIVGIGEKTAKTIAVYFEQNA